MTGNFFCIFTSLLIFAAVDLHAGEPIMEPVLTLAMNQSAGKIFLATPADLLSDADVSFTGFNLANNRPVTVNPAREAATEISADVRFEKQTNPARHDAFLLLYENLTSNSRSNVSFSLEAGYSRIWDEKSMLQKICCDRQDPGCAYVGANFSF